MNIIVHFVCWENENEEERFDGIVGESRGRGRCYYREKKGMDEKMVAKVWHLTRIEDSIIIASRSLSLNLWLGDESECELDVCVITVLPLSGACIYLLFFRFRFFIILFYCLRFWEWITHTRKDQSSLRTDVRCFAILLIRLRPLSSLSKAVCFNAIMFVWVWVILFHVWIIFLL